MYHRTIHQRDDEGRRRPRLQQQRRPASLTSATPSSLQKQQLLLLRLLLLLLSVAIISMITASSDEHAGCGRLGTSQKSIIGSSQRHCSGLFAHAQQPTITQQLLNFPVGANLTKWGAPPIRTTKRYLNRDSAPSAVDDTNPTVTHYVTMGAPDMSFFDADQAGGVCIYTATEPASAALEGQAAMPRPLFREFAWHHYPLDHEACGHAHALVVTDELTGYDRMLFAVGCPNSTTEGHQRLGSFFLFDEVYGVDPNVRNVVHPPQQYQRDNLLFGGSLDMNLQGTLAVVGTQEGKSEHIFLYRRQRFSLEFEPITTLNYSGDASKYQFGMHVAVAPTGNEVVATTFEPGKGEIGAQVFVSSDPADESSPWVLEKQGGVLRTNCYAPNVKDASSFGFAYERDIEAGLGFIAIGCPLGPLLGYGGRVYLFSANMTAGWKDRPIVIELNTPIVGSLFGAAIALRWVSFEENYYAESAPSSRLEVAIGAPNSKTTGEVFVFKCHEVKPTIGPYGSVCTLIANFTAAQGGLIGFGSALAITDAHIFVGSPTANSGFGAAWHVHVDHCGDADVCGRADANATCVATLTTHRCLCGPGFTGTNCSTVARSVDVLQDRAGIKLGDDSEVVSVFSSNGEGEREVHLRASSSASVIVHDARLTLGDADEVDSLGSIVSGSKSLLDLINRMEARLFALEFPAPNTYSQYPRSNDVVHYSISYLIISFDVDIRLADGIDSFNVEIMADGDGDGFPETFVSIVFVDQSYMDTNWDQNGNYDLRIVYPGYSLNLFDRQETDYYFIFPYGVLASTASGGRSVWDPSQSSFFLRVSTWSSVMTVTNAVYRPTIDFSTVSMADSLCKAESGGFGGAPPYGGSWYAVLSDPSTSYETRFSSPLDGNEEYYPLRNGVGDEISGRLTDLTNGNAVTGGLFFDFSDTNRTGSITWTGTDSTGGIGQTCSSWSDSGSVATVGLVGSTTQSIERTPAELCSASYHLYCIYLISSTAFAN